jgi:hypothetical protein
MGDLQNKDLLQRVLRKRYDNSSKRDLEVNTSYALYDWRDCGRSHRRRR